MTPFRRGVVALALLALSACATTSMVAPAPVPMAGWTHGAATTRTVGLGLPGGARLADGVRFAGGIEIVLPTDSPLHSLSDFKLVDGAHGFVSVTDAGDLVRGRLTLNSQGRLTGVSGLQYRRLTLTDGQPITEKFDGDAEGLLVTDGGDLFISFERNHRIWNYGPVNAPHARPTVVRHPDHAFPLNDGMATATIASPAWIARRRAAAISSCSAPIARRWTFAPRCAGWTPPGRWGRCWRN
jgi:hypothetical protein